MKITLRDLFWLTLVVALSVGWFLDHRWDTAKFIAAVQSSLAAGPPGVVIAVSNAKLVEVSMGSDDGLKVGQTMVVYRGTLFLGQITLRSTTPDRAIGQIDTRLLRGKILKGDKAAPIWTDQHLKTDWCGT